ncbi:MAG: 2-phospho-L-lactate guanylyltransferase [Actinomycetota bacterium]
MTSPPPQEPRSAAVLVPVKSFDLAKGRLADAMAADERARLARSMAERVVAAAAGLPAFVVCATDEVAEWAVGVGAEVIRFEPPGLNAAVTHAARELAERGFNEVIVAHGDLPLAKDLTWLVDFDGVTVVADRRGDGTNVLVVPLGTGFEFHYGPGSARAHRTEARRVGLPHRTIDDPELGWDVDTPDDLNLPEADLRAVSGDAEAVDGTATADDPAEG